mgnify:CR=1 FL=1
MAILAVQAATWMMGAPVRPTLVVPVRPALMRESTALVIGDASPPAPPFDAARLCAALVAMERTPSLALRPDQRMALLVLARPQAARARGAQPDRREERAQAFRATFMRVTVGVLAALRPDQAAAIVWGHQERYVEFEAAYWGTLRDRLREGGEPLGEGGRT